MDTYHNHISFKKLKNTTILRLSLVIVIAVSNDMALNFIMYLLHAFDEIIRFSSRLRFKR